MIVGRSGLKTVLGPRALQQPARHLATSGFSWSQGQGGLRQAPGSKVNHVLAVRQRLFTVAAWAGLLLGLLPMSAVLAEQHLVIMGNTLSVSCHV
jgi:hypothetical protein